MDIFSTAVPQTTGSVIGSETIEPTSSGVNVNPGLFDKFVVSLGHEILQFSNPSVVGKDSYATSSNPANAPAVSDNTSWLIGLGVVLLVFIVIFGRR